MWETFKSLFYKGVFKTFLKLRYCYMMMAVVGKFFTYLSICL